MTVKNEKRILTALLAAMLFVATALFAFFSYAHADGRTQETAFADDTSWTPYVKLHVGDGEDPVEDYETIMQPMDLTGGSSIGFFVRIVNPSNSDTYKYCLSTTELSSSALPAYMSNYGSTVSGQTATRTEEGQTVTYLWSVIDVDNDFSGYVYFRRECTVWENEQSRVIYDVYPVATQLIYTYTDTSTAPAITRVTANIANGSPYDGTWVSGVIKFTVVTQSMAPTEDNPEGTTSFNSQKELLFYSVDGGANYTRILSGNTVEIKEQLLVSCPITFKVTNLSGTLSHEYVYGEEGNERGEYPVCMDPNRPYFQVYAQTVDVNGETVEYENGTWSSHAVSFTIHDISNCYSENGAITYEISTAGGEYMATNTTSTIDRTTTNVQFRATSKAGLIYDYTTIFNVRIDGVTPNIYVAASTPDPDNDKESRSLRSTTNADGALDFGYANGDIRVSIFNRNASGVQINNASGAIFEYQQKRATGYSGTWTRMMDKPVTGRDSQNAEDTGYAVDDSAQSAVSVTRSYKFRIRTNAGLVSEEVEVTFTLIKSSYLIELGEITAEMNEFGWIADKAEVLVSVPTDSQRQADGTYSTPTVGYTFRYKASNSEEDVGAYDTGMPVSFHEEVDNEIRWWYKFNIIASADSTFIIDAYNAAGKKSANTVTTDEKIRIDVLDPVYSLSAFIEPVDASSSELKPIPDVNDPGWVNGQIRLVLRVRNGVSGVYVKELIYTEEGGKIVRDTAGNIIWQPRNQTMTGNRLEEGAAVWFEYPIILNPSNNEKEYVGSTEYKYRIYTNSGKYVDVGFTANVDTSETIAVKGFTVTSGANKTQDVEVRGTAGSGFIDMATYDFSVCEDTEISFVSSLDREGIEDHYRIRYQLFDGSTVSADRLLSYAAGLPDADYVYLSAEDKLPLHVDENVQGDFYIAVCVESEAVAYDDSYAKAGPYVIKLHYDTKNLVITYQIEAYDGGVDVSDRMNAGRWVKGQLQVTIEVRTGDSEGELDLGNYSFYYIGLDSVNDTNYTEDDWIRVDQGQLTENASDFNYRFTLTFSEISFKKYIGVSVCNAAGYRSKQSAVHANEIKVDNTTPSVDEIIVFNTNETDVANGLIVEGVRGDVTEKRPNNSTTYYLYSYYSTSDISLINRADDSRSGVTYSYVYLGQEEISADKLKQKRTDMIELSGRALNVFGDANVPVEANGYEVVYYAIYGVNEVGTEARGGVAMSDGSVEFTYIYRFVYDAGSLEGTLKYDTNTGYNNPNTNMFSYLWKDDINLFATGSGSAAPATETEYVMFQFSVDDGATWYNYNFAGLETWYGSGYETTLSFSPDLLRYYYNAEGDCEFENGVSKVFLFRARNKAGAILVYGNVFIAMENTVPEFTVTTTVNDVSYDGGSTDLTRSPNVWASAPVTIEINPTVVPASGITYMYYLEYSNGSSFSTTTQKKLTNLRFSTDTLDGFNVNKDALLTIVAYSNSNSERQYPVTVRIAVDQVVPEFLLTGIAFNKESNITTQIASGDWTNRNSVSVSRSVKEGVVNVSAVRYTYSIQTKETSTATANWDDDIGSIDVTESCVITVTATTEAGVTYRQEFEVNIDTTPPIIEFDGGMNVIEGEEYYIDLRVIVREANIKICEYIVIKENDRGFNFAPEGYILSTSSVDNSTRYDKMGVEYRGYVKVYVEDYAGNTASIWFYVLPMKLTVNNITLSDEDLAQVQSYEDNLNKARVYMETNRISYFANLISRLRDRISTLETEIAGYRQYLEDLNAITSFTLTDHYRTMYEFKETFHNYEVYGNAWVQTAITGDATSKYYAYYQNFLTEFGKLQALMSQVETVQDHVIALPAINMVEAEDYEEILRVYDEYRNLTQDQREAFATNLKNKLDDLKEDCEVLLLVDSEIGVKINGDFAPGATISVTEYVENTDTYVKAQKVLYEQISSDKPRTIVSIYRVALDNEYAQTSASDIVVTLPIQEEYRSYIYFSVYELSNDGSVKLVQDTEIQPDGASVQFETDALTTYVLCAKTELEKGATNEGVYGSILGLELTTEMIRYLIYIGAALFGIVLLIVIITGIRHRRFLNSYNRAYRHSLYRKSVRGIPKGNKIK